MTWTYGFGLDVGVRDKNGFSVIAWREFDPCAYIIRAYALEGTVSDVHEEILRLQQQFVFAYMVVDQGGMGLELAEELRRRKHVPLEAADKSAKAAAYRLFNADLKDGRIKVVRPYCQDLLKEWDSLPWHDNGMREAEGYRCDVSDSVLYNWRKCMAFIERPAPPPLTYEQRFEELEQRMIAQDERDLMEEQSEWGSW
jgi:hypothetical protein